MNISLSVIEGNFPPSCPVMYSGPESVRKGTPEPFVPKARTTLPERLCYSISAFHLEFVSMAVMWDHMQSYAFLGLVPSVGVRI